MQRLEFSKDVFPSSTLRLNIHTLGTDTRPSLFAPETTNLQLLPQLGADSLDMSKHPPNNGASVASVFPFSSPAADSLAKVPEHTFGADFAVAGAAREPFTIQAYAGGHFAVF